MDQNMRENLLIFTGFADNLIKTTGQWVF